MKIILPPALALLGALLTPAPSWAYIAAMPTLGKVSKDASHIVVLEVDKVSRDKQVVIFKKVADLKGNESPDVAKHKLTDGFHPRQARTILDWAEPGKTAVCFENENVCLTCIGGFWYGREKVAGTFLIKSESNYGTF
jgi:hypothetical protein